MTRPNVKLTKKQLVLLVIIAVGLLVFGILTAVSGAVYSEPDCQPDLCSICHHHMAVWSAVFRDAVPVYRCHVEAVPASGATGFHGKSR